MAIGGLYILNQSMQANEALVKHRAVKLVTTADQLVDQCDTLGESVFGIVNETVSAQDATDGRVVAVHTHGVAVWECGAALAVGDRVRVDASGRCVELAAATANQDQAGIVVRATSASGEWASVMLTPSVQYST